MNIFRKGRLSKDEIAQWLLDLRGNAYPPESGFGVSGVFRARFQGVDDYYFGGVNVENIDPRIGTHGEEACIAAIVTGLGRNAEIAEGWVMGAPQHMKPTERDPAVDRFVSCCGKCRQQIASLAGADVEIHSVSLSEKISTTTVGAFLPDLYTFRAFTEVIAADADARAIPFPEEKIRNRLVRHGQLQEKEIAGWLRDIESVDYMSKISQSIVLKLDNGYYAAGAKIEEAASVSMNAAQTALAIAVSAFGECKVQEAWVYTKGRDGKEIPADSFGTLAMSALQTILQCAEHDEIPVRFFAEDGSIVQTTLSGTAKLAPTSRRPFHKKP